jgi:hypothetical protein
MRTKQIDSSFFESNQRGYLNDFTFKQEVWQQQQQQAGILVD